MCLYRNISAIWLAFPWSAGLKRHHTISFFIPEHFHCQKSQSSLLHFRIFHSHLVQGLWLSCDSNGLGFCLCRVSVRPYLLFILPDAIWFANSSHSFSLVTQGFEQSMSPTSQAAVASSLREKAPAPSHNPRPEQLVLGNILCDMSPSLLHDLQQSCTLAAFREPFSVSTYTVPLFI